MQGNITFAIAIIGGLLSLYNFFLDWWRHLKHLDIIVEDVFIFEQTVTNLGMINLMIINKSTSAISVSRIEITCSEVTTSYGKYRLPSGSTMINKEVVSSCSTDQLPIKIEALSPIKILICPDDFSCNVMPKTECEITLYTSRGRIIETFRINDYGDDRLLLESQKPN